MYIKHILSLVTLLAYLSRAQSAQGTNLQKFTDKLLNIEAPPVTEDTGKFVVTVNGKKERTFKTAESALEHSCNLQVFDCSKAVVGGKAQKDNASIGKCKKQHADCLNKAKSDGNAANKDNNNDNKDKSTNDAGKEKADKDKEQKSAAEADNKNDNKDKNTKDAGKEKKSAAEADNKNDNKDKEKQSAAVADNKNDNKDKEKKSAAEADNKNDNKDKDKKSAASSDNNNADQGAKKAAKAEVKAEPTQPTGLKNDAGFCPAVGLGNAINDGTQKKTQTCSTTVQGAIPAFDKMVSTIILSPKSDEKIKMGTDVKVKVRTNNMQLGFFEDPNKRYYQSPQTLNNQGVIEGHQHLSVQNLGNGQTPPDPRTESLAFFKGLDAKSNDGILEITVPGDSFKSPGEYRFCTITGSRTHQPVIMPVAKRGSQDDCVRVKIVN